MFCCCCFGFSISRAQDYPWKKNPTVSLLITGRKTVKQTRKKNLQQNTMTMDTGQIQDLFSRFLHLQFPLLQQLIKSSFNEYLPFKFER